MLILRLKYTCIREGIDAQGRGRDCPPPYVVVSGAKTCRILTRDNMFFYQNSHLHLLCYPSPPSPPTPLARRRGVRGRWRRRGEDNRGERGFFGKFLPFGFPPPHFSGPRGAGGRNYDPLFKYDWMYLLKGIFHF